MVADMVPDELSEKGFVGSRMVSIGLMFRCAGYLLTVVVRRNLHHFDQHPETRRLTPRTISHSAVCNFSTRSSNHWLSLGVFILDLDTVVVDLTKDAHGLGFTVAGVENALEDNVCFTNFRLSCQKER